MKKYRMKSMSINSLMMLVSALLVTTFIGCTSKDDDPTVGMPTVTDFTPYTDEGLTNGGHVGSVIKLSGSYYSAAGTNTVKFNGVDAEVVTSKTKIGSLTVVVPSGATSGKVTVTVKGFTGTSTKDFTVSAGNPAPAIIDYSPTSGNGADGVEVTINGYNFSTTPANNVVKFNGVAATVSSAKAKELKVIIPSGSKTGKMTISVSGVTGTAESEKDFTIPTPEVSTFTPSGSIEGSTVIITGANLSKTLVGNVVDFNGVVATVTAYDKDKGQLTVLVPTGATSGKISITVDGVKGTSKDSFTVN